MESGSDYVRVFESASTADTPVEEYDGSHMGVDRVFTSNIITILLTSDGGSSWAGFSSVICFLGNVCYLDDIHQ